MPKLLIITNSNDSAVNKICNWLNFYQVPYKRLNDELLKDFFDHIKLSNEDDDICIRYKNELIHLLDYDLIWFRRGFLVNKYYSNDADFSNKKIISTVKKNIEIQNESIIRYIEIAIKGKSINFPSYYNVDKLNSLRVAKTVGFTIPKSIFFNGNIKLNPNKEYFIKPNSIDLFPFSNKEFYFDSPHIHIKNKENITCGLTLIQEYEQKIFELRIFYFCGYIYSVCILSQSDKNTRYDSRNIKEKKIQYPPFKLDKILKNKIINFMNLMNLESGSIDIIYNEKKEYIFLEVNPVGMFDYIGVWSGRCIEKQVALKIKKELIKREKK